MKFSTINLKPVLFSCIFFVVTILTSLTPLFAQTSWKQQNANTTKKLESVHFVDAYTGWAVGWDGTVLHTNNSGDTWQSQTSSTSFDLMAVHFANEKSGGATGLTAYDGNIIQTNDSGNSWKEQHQSTTRFRDIHFATPAEGWVVGDNGYILHTSDSGKTWNTQTTSSNEDLHSIQFINDTTGWAAAASGTLLHTTDGGSTWNTQSINTTNSLETVFFYNDSTGWVGGTNGALLYTSDSGNTWTDQSPSGAGTINSIHFGWAVDNSGSIFHTTDSGKTWEEEYAADHALNSVYFPTPLVGYAVGSNGAILKGEIPMGIAHSNFKNEINVAPNPTTNGKVSIQLEKPYKKVQAKLINSKGKVMESRQAGTTKQLKLNFDSKPGVYFLTLQTASGKNANIRIIKK